MQLNTYIPIEPACHDEMIHYLTQVSEQANLHLTFLESQTIQTMADRAAIVLMSSFLYLYACHAKGQCQLPPPPQSQLELAVKSCATFRKHLFRHPRIEWNEEEKDLYRLIMAFVYLYKKQYLYCN